METQSVIFKNWLKSIHGYDAEDPWECFFFFLIDSVSDHKAKFQEVE